MATQKDVFVHAAIAMDALINDFLNFIAIGKRQYVVDQIMKASRLDEEDLDSVMDAVDRVLFVMKAVAENGTGDMEGHRVRQKKMAEIRSIMNIGRAYPDAAIKRLKALPAKRLLNA